MIESGQSIDWKKEIDCMRVNEIRQKEKERCVALLDRTITD